MALTTDLTSSSSTGCVPRPGVPAWLSTARVRRLAWALLATALVAPLVVIGEVHSAQIIRNAVCNANAGQVDCNSAGLGGITNAADALISPVFVALVAICPIACLVGAGAVMFGHRRGVIMIASALGALVLAGAVKGIVA